MKDKDGRRIGVTFEFNGEQRTLQWMEVTVKEQVVRKIEGKKRKIILEKTHVAFYDPDLAKELKDCDSGNTDATYDFKTDIEGVQQLLTVMATLHGKVSNRCYSLIFI